MKTKGTRPEGIVFTNADPRYAGKLDDPQGGDATMLMQQVRERERLFLLHNHTDL